MIGAHVDNLNDIELVRKNKSKLVQIFLPTSNKSLEVLKKYFIKFNMDVVVHSPYTINIANDWDENSTQINYLIAEIIRSSRIGAKWFVVHTGKVPKNTTIEEAFNNIYSSILYVHNKTKKYPIDILLETSVGEKNEMLSNLNDFAELMNKIKSDRIGICIDTCHIFASGYQINKDTFDLIVNLFGIDKIKLVHLNDSKNDIGSHKDRHMSLGKGYIGIDNLIKFKNLCEEHNIPMIMEVPRSEITENFNLLRPN